MLGLQEDGPLEMLRQFSVYLRGDLIENFGAAQLHLNNENGSGVISLYELLPGLTAWVYNIHLVSELEIDMTFSENKPYYFGYNVNGYQLQKFPRENKYRKILQGQNFILIGEPGLKSQFIVPGNIDYKCCYLIVDPVLIRESKAVSKKKLLEDLDTTFEGSLYGSPYRYFGKIDTKVGGFAEFIVNNSRTDLVGRLNTEGAVMNMLAAQIDAHVGDMNSDSLQPKLLKAELSRITDIGDYILENMSERLTIDRLSRYVAMSPKKVQAGIRFLYGCSANEYLTKLKLEHAKELMHLTDDSVSEICFKTGYASKSYFSKVFTDYFGVLPSTYKNSLEQKNMLFEISYRSFARTDLTTAEFENIVETALAMNQKFMITGCLIYQNHVFFQIIEGPKRHILQLYKNIKSDDRHSDLELMWKGYKVKRDFGDWSLATLSDRSILNIDQQGSSKTLNLEHVMGKIDRSSMASHNLWRKVRNVIKVNNEPVA